MSPPRIYLAGPEVFLPNAIEIGEAKCTICRELGLQGRFPLDNEPLPGGLSLFAKARHISLTNEELMRTCDAILANMTPFRGAAMDSGTAFEVGFMRALQKPVFGYTNATADYKDRAQTMRARGLSNDDFDGPDVEIEDFSLAENLMIAIAVSETGSDVHRYMAAPGEDMRTDLAGFRQAASAAAHYFRPESGAQ